MIRTDYLPSCGYAICQDPDEFPFTTDSVFLGNFPHVVTKARALELGCGTGAVSLYLTARGATDVTGVDINPRMVELLNRSAAENGLSRQAPRRGIGHPGHQKLVRHGKLRPRGGQPAVPQQRQRAGTEDRHHRVP
jgi:SAM-dependent methyltransferase